MKKIFTLLWLVLAANSSFAQNCAPTVTPFLEDFESVFAPDVPDCVTVEDADGDSDTWFTIEAQVGPTTTNLAAYASFSGNDPDDWFFVRGINAAQGDVYEIEFEYAVFHPYGEYIEITAGTDPASFAIIGSPIFSDYVMDTFITTMTLSYTATTNGPIYFGWHLMSPNPSNGFAVDNISINKVGFLPACDTAHNLSAVATSDKSANITWDAVDNATGYVYVLSESSVTPTGSGTLTTNSNYSISGLMPNTQYYFFLKTICGNDNSSWIKRSFTTQPTGIESVRNSIGVEVYPNPTTDKVVVKGDGVKDAEILLTDMLGRRIESTVLENGSITIDMSSLEAGIYFVKVIDGPKQSIVKVTKQ